MGSLGGGKQEGIMELTFTENLFVTIVLVLAIGVGILVLHVIGLGILFWADKFKRKGGGIIR
jgi:hypothetical protein